MNVFEWFLQPIIKRQEQTMADLQTIKDQTAALVESVRKNEDTTAAVKEYVTGIKAQLTDVQEQLAAALAGQASPEDLQALSDQLATLVSTIDADTVAEAAITG